MSLPKTRTIIIVVTLVYLVFFLKLDESPSKLGNSYLKPFIHLFFSTGGDERISALEEFLSSGFLFQPNRKFGYSRVLDYDALLFYNESFRISSMIEQEAKAFSYRSLMDDFLFNKYELGSLLKSDKSITVPDIQNERPSSEKLVKKYSNADKGITKILLKEAKRELFGKVVQETVISIQSGLHGILFFFIKQSSGVQELDYLFLDKIKKFFLARKQGEVSGEYYLDWKALLLNDAEKIIF